MPLVAVQPMATGASSSALPSATGGALQSADSSGAASVQEPVLSAAAAWAKKKKEAIERAAALRAERLQNTLGMVHVDFLDRVAAAESRDEERASNRNAGTPAKTRPAPPLRKAPTPISVKVGSSSSSKKKKGGGVKSPTSPLKKKRAAAAAAKLAHDKAMQARRQSTKPAAIDPGRELVQHGYEPLGPIAAGAFSTILRAREVATGAEVAVKTFDAAKCGKAAPLAEARDAELRVLRLLAASGGGGGGGGRHPHIAHMLTEHATAAATHAVLEYCSGGSLQRHLQLLQKGRAATRGASAGSAAGSSADAVGMPEAQVAVLAWQVASALEFMHGLDVAHRDVKPGNILFDGPLGAHEPCMRVKLCDFGFATRCGKKWLKKQVGTPSYTSPELTIPPDAHDGYRGKPVDMWALGCVLYEALHGKHCFYGASLEQLGTRIRAVSHEPFSKELSSGPRQLVGALVVGAPERRLTATQALSHAWLKHGRKQFVAAEEHEARVRAAQRDLEGGGGGGAGDARPRPSASPIDLSVDDGAEPTPMSS